MERLSKNSSGYYELQNKPSSEELKEYYAEKYYQNQKSTYRVEYSDDELRYIENKLLQKKFILEKNLSFNLKHKNFLDIGCGEGYSMKFFEAQGMNVKGIDYSNHGIKLHNANQVENLLVGEVNEVLNELILDSQKFDLILLDNLLEHVDNPSELISQIYNLISDEGFLIIEVPNDFSELQMHLLNQKLVEKPYWIVTPDHLSYFSKDSLVNFCDEYNFKNLLVLGDFPIDLNLLYEGSNYIINPKIGSDLHKKRLAIENYLTETNTEELIDIYISLAKMNLGRNITGYFSKK